MGGSCRGNPLIPPLQNHITFSLLLSPAPHPSIILSHHRGRLMMMKLWTQQRSQKSITFAARRTHTSAHVPSNGFQGGEGGGLVLRLAAPPNSPSRCVIPVSVACVGGRAGGFLSRAGNLVSWLIPQTCSDTLELGVLKWPQPDSHPVIIINSSLGIIKQKKKSGGGKVKRQKTDRQTDGQSCWLRFDAKKQLSKGTDRLRICVLLFSPSMQEEPDYEFSLISR